MAVRGPGCSLAADWCPVGDDALAPARVPDGALGPALDDCTTGLGEWAPATGGPVAELLGGETGRSSVPALLLGSTRNSASSDGVSPVSESESTGALFVAAPAAWICCSWAPVGDGPTGVDAVMPRCAPDSVRGALACGAAGGRALRSPPARSIPPGGVADIGGRCVPLSPPALGTSDWPSCAATSTVCGFDTPVGGLSGSNGIWGPCFEPEPPSN